jgi:hypothetical protein
MAGIFFGKKDRIAILKANFSQMKILNAIFCVWVLTVWSSVPGWSQSTSTTLYEQLEKAVEAKSWESAITIVDELLQTVPSRTLELKDYRRQLQRLARQDLPQLPSSIKAVQVQGKVFSTRSEQRIRVLDPGEVVIVTTPNGGSFVVDEVSTPVELPEEYQIRVTFVGSFKQPEEAEVTVTLSGGGEASDKRTIRVGGSFALKEEVYIFPAYRVKAPQSVKIQVNNDQMQIFSVGLPHRETILTEGKFKRSGVSN